MKVEIRIFATKEVALDQFKNHFFDGKESFYLKNSENWLQNMLNLYQDTGLRPFQAIKVSSKLSLPRGFQGEISGKVLRDSFWIHDDISEKKPVGRNLPKSDATVKLLNLHSFKSVTFSWTTKTARWKMNSKKLDAQFTIELYEKLMMVNQ